MGHSAPFVVSRDGRYFHDGEHVFSAACVEDALVFTDPDFISLWDGMPDVKIEYLAAAIAREDQERMQLADLRW